MDNCIWGKVENPIDSKITEFKAEIKKEFKTEVKNEIKQEMQDALIENTTPTVETPIVEKNEVIEDANSPTDINTGGCSIS